MADPEEATAGEDPAEHWYWVKAKFKAVHLGVARKRHLWESLVFLIRGPFHYELSPPAEVRRKAEEIARSKEHQYEAAGGHMVRWVLQEVAEIVYLGEDKIEEGTEVYWRFFEKVDKQPTTLPAQHAAGEKLE